MTWDIRLADDVTKQPWRTPWLIQRVEKPRENLAALNPFSFGGGLMHGGLSKEASVLLSKLWQFDYMGASEFEWGAVPAALAAMVKYREAECLVGFMTDVTGPGVKIRDKRHPQWAEEDDSKVEHAEVFVMCNAAHRAAVVDYLNVLVDPRKAKPEAKPALKEPAHAWRALFNPAAECIGGIELYNGWLYLTTRVMPSVVGICSMFEIENSGHAATPPKKAKKS